MTMKMSKFEMLPISDTEILGNQAVISFGEYELSIIDNGYGKEKGLYEIGVFKNGVMTELPGVTAEGDTVKGFLTETDVDVILKKMYLITGVEPQQI